MRTFPFIWQNDKYTHGCISLTTLSVKHYNDLLDRRSSGRSRDEFKYFSVGDIFCLHLGTTYANFQEKIFPETSGKKFQTFPCYYNEKFGSFSQNFREHLFLENWHTQSQDDVYKKVPYRGVCDFIPAPSRTSSIKQVIVVLC